MPNPKSTASIEGHPIHSMLIPFPVAFFVATLVCDIIYWQTAVPAWATAAIWLLGAGIIGAVLAGIASLADLFGDRQIRRLSDTWWHAGGNVIVVAPPSRSTIGLRATPRETVQSCPRV